MPIFSIKNDQLWFEMRMKLVVISGKTKDYELSNTILI